MLLHWTQIGVENFPSTYKFCSILINQLINLRNVRTENLRLRTDLLDRVMELVSNTTDGCFEQQIAKKIFNMKIKAGPINAGLNTAFKHCISFATDLAANFGCYPLRIMSDIVSKLLRLAAVLFDWNLSRLPFLGHVIYLDLLLCTGFNLDHAVLLLCHNCTQSPIND